MCMQTTVPVSSQAAKNGSQYPLWMLGRPEVGRDLAEAHGAHAARGVAAHLGGRQLGVPERDDAQRDEPAAAVAAPLLDHPVVVGHDAGLRELLVLRLEEGLAAEARERREAQGGLDPVDLHVRDAGLGLVAAGPHLVVGDRRHRHVVAVEADRGDVALVDVDEILVDPAVGLRAVGVERLAVDAAADVLHLADAPPLALGPRSRKRAGSHVSQRCAGSTTWSSTLMILGSGVVLPRRGVVSSMRSVMAAPVWPRKGRGVPSDSSSARTDGCHRPGPEHDLVDPEPGVVLELALVGDGAEGDDGERGGVRPASSARRRRGMASARPPPPMGIQPSAYPRSRRRPFGGATADQGAHPRLLYRLGPGPRRREVDELAVELGLLGGPDGLHGGQVLADDVVAPGASRRRGPRPRRGSSRSRPRG